MPMKDPHGYMTRSAADLQMQNPKNPAVKLPSANKKAKLGERFGKLAAKKKSKGAFGKKDKY